MTHAFDESDAFYSACLIYCMLNGVENSNACGSARDSDLSGFTFNIAFNFYLLI